MTREEFIKKWKQRAWNPENQKLYDKMESDLDELLKEHTKAYGRFILRISADAISKGMEGIQALPESDVEWYDTFNNQP